VLDGSDNFESRYLVSEAAARAGVAPVWGAGFLGGRPYLLAASCRLMLVTV